LKDKWEKDRKRIITGGPTPREADKKRKKGKAQGFDNFPCPPGKKGGEVKFRQVSLPFLRIKAKGGGGGGGKRK